MGRHDASRVHHQVVGQRKLNHSVQGETSSQLSIILLAERRGQLELFRASWAVSAECVVSGQHPLGARIHRRQTALVCSCLIKVLRRRASARHISCKVDAHFAEPAFVITMDASPCGLSGAFEYKGRPLGCFTDRVQTDDVQKLEIEMEPRIFRTLLEAPAVLVAVRWWSEYGRSATLSTLGAVNKLHSKTLGIATVMLELALIDRKRAYTVQVLEPGPRTHNEWVDALCRVWQLGPLSSISSELLEVTQRHLPLRDQGRRRHVSVPSRGKPTAAATSPSTVRLTRSWWRTERSRAPIQSRGRVS